MTDTDPFSDSPITRRRFVRLAAATGAALSLPANATAAVESRAFTTEYRYVLNHTPEAHAVPTLVRFSDTNGVQAFEATGVGTDVHTTTQPEPAAYGKLTASEAERTGDLPTVAELSHSPGSNPFWRLGFYPMGVFPEPRRSTGFVDFEQMIDGLGHLEAAYRGEPGSPDLRAYPIGDSPGHYNYLSDRDDPKGVWVAEVTNDVDDESSFRDKEKVFYSLSLHGLERAGAEAGSRFIEGLLRGEEAEIESLLDDVVLVFCYTNPDGWVAKHPQYGSNWQLGETGPTGEVPAGPLYERGNAEVFDTNRQYPTVGYITTDHYPGEPDDPADRSLEKVTDTLAIVDHFRNYENLNYGADLHGMLNSSQFVLGLISQDQFTTRDLHELYEMNRLIDEVLEEELDTWETLADLQGSLPGDTNPEALGWKTLPETAYDYSTIWDTLGYTVSGALGDWMAHPERHGGLGMTTMDFEMAYSHMVGANVYNPELVEMQTTGYQTAVRAIATYAYENSETPNTADEFETRTNADGETVAYVTTGPVGTAGDALRRTDDQLEFVVYDAFQSFRFEGVVGPGVESGAGTTWREAHEVTAPEGADRIDAQCDWGATVQDNEFRLYGPDGNLIGESTTFPGPERITQSVEGGETYTLVIETYANAASTYEIWGDWQAESATSDDGVTTTSSSSSATTSAGGVEVLTHDVAAADLHSLTVHLHAQQALFETELISPSGDVVRSFDPNAGDTVGGKCCGHPEWDVSAPETGTWAVRAKNTLEEPQSLEVRFGTLQSTTRTPDPEAAVGYEQREYDVTPFRFFEDYADSIPDADGGDFVPVTTGEVADGTLLEDDLTYDHVVVIHDAINASDGASDVDPGSYLSRLDEYVDEGGNLVLTDSGVRLLSGMDNDLVGDLSTDDLRQNIEDLAHLGDTNPDHPLLTDARPIQKALWKVAPLGYKTSGEAPMYQVDADAFANLSGEGIDASIGATTSGNVSLGSVTRDDGGSGIHVVSGLLPPANQENLHPFGLLDYTTSFLGYLVVTSALGFTQERRLADGTVRTFGRGDEWSVDGENDGEPLDASGSREDDGSVFTAGQTNHVSVAAEANEPVLFRDQLPIAWDVQERFGDYDHVHRDEDAGVVRVVFTPHDSPEPSPAGEYFAEAPDGADGTGSYTFGPLQVSEDGETWTDIDGTTETNYVVGVDTS